MQSRSLEERIQRIEDIEAIRELKMEYCRHCDNNYDPDPIAALFTEDAIWDGGNFGRYEGREAIRNFFRQVSGKLPFAMHYVTNSSIDVQGNQAIGRWYLHCPVTFAEGNQAVWGAGFYEDHYVKVNDKWFIKGLKVISTFWTPLDKGWVKQRWME
jgi:hypothetical protein